jgi:hypothetical protein
MDGITIGFLFSLGLLALVIVVRLLGWDPAKSRARRGLPPLSADKSRLGLGVRRLPGESHGWPTRPLFYIDGRGRLPRFSLSPRNPLAEDGSDLPNSNRAHS